MKRQPPVPKKAVVPVSAPPARYIPGEDRFGWRTLLWVVPFFLLVVFTADTSLPYLCILVGLVCCGLFIEFRRRLSPGRFGPQALFAALYILLGGISCFYASSGRLALQEFLRLLISFFVYLLILLFAGHGKSAGRNAAAALSVGAALFSFLSIDYVSTRWFSFFFQRMTSYFTTSYLTSSGLEAGTRITSILEDPNVFAGVAGIGVLLALGLALSSVGRERIVHLCCLFVSSLGFILVFSLGAAGFILIAFVLFLLFLSREDRLPALMVMLETLVLAALAAVLCYAAVFDGTSDFSLVPLACMVLGSAGLCLLDRALTGKLSAALSGHRKAALAVLVGAAALIAVYAVAAVTLTGSVTLNAGESLDRAAYLDAGDYTCTADASAPGLRVTVTSQNESDLIMHTSATLYDGDAAACAFTVPEDSQIVWFRFSGESGGTLASFTYSGSESGSVKLGYKLLPGFMANRLQGLQKNQNAIQRAEFWRDGISLWKKSPVLGRGLASFANELFSVSSFYYVSKYVHNHYVQLLADLGVVGLAVFIGLLCASAWLFLRARKRKDASPLLPCLGAALAFMILQAIIQVDFSSHSFLPFAFGVFALLNVCGEREAAPDEKFSPLAPALSIASAVLCFIWPVILIFSLYGMHFASSGGGMFANRLERAARLDPLNRQSYAIAYVNERIGKSGDNAYLQQKTEEYAAEIAANPTNDTSSTAAEYYLTAGETEKGVDALLAHLQFNRVRSEVWQAGFELLIQHDDGSQEYLRQVHRVSAALNDWNAQAMEPIVLTGMAASYAAANA